MAAAKKPVANPFAQKAATDTPPTVAEVDEAIYGKIKGPNLTGVGQQTANDIPLDQIQPDPAQPRRAVPFSIRRKAKQDGIAEWLAWYQIAERLLGKEIPLKALLRGEGEGSDTETTGLPLVDDFLDLVTLASSINRDGLANAITVAARGMDRYVIETGERRYQACKMLFGVLQEERLSKIKARVVAKSSVWAQAAENAQRKPLNAIGIARQLAILIMELNKGRDGISYAPYSDFGETRDREFYAQVANGVVHRIPKGASEQILQATGLKTREQIARYRGLLGIPDELWIQADEENFTEFKVREMSRPPQDMLSTDNISESSRPAPSSFGGPKNITGGPMRWPLEGEGRRFMWLDGKLVQLESAETFKGVLSVRGWNLDANGKRIHAFYTPMSNLKEEPPSSPAPVMPAVSYAAIGQNSATTVKAGQRRRSSQGRVFEVMTVTGNLTSCYEINTRTGTRIPGSPFTIATARLLDMPIEGGAETDIPDWITVGQVVIRDHDIAQYRYKGPVTGVSWDPGVKDYLVSLRWAGDGKIHGPYPASALRPDDGSEPRAENNYAEPDEDDEGFDDETEGEPDISAEDALNQIERPALPGWAVKGMSVETISGRRGIMGQPYWNDETNGWQTLVTNQYGDQKHHVEHLVPVPTAIELAPIASPDTRLIIEDVPEGFIDEPADANPLPDWAQVGMTVRHIDSGEVCTVTDATRRSKHDVWVLRVQLVNGNFEHARVDEFEAFTEIASLAAEPHPALNPHNVNGVICEDQGLISLVQEIARRVGMDRSVMMVLNAAMADTADGLRKRQQSGGFETTQAYLDTGHAGQMAAINELVQRLNNVHQQKSIVNYQISQGA